jgi:hypothetical protein
VLDYGATVTVPIFRVCDPSPDLDAYCSISTSMCPGVGGAAGNECYP